MERRVRKISALALRRFSLFCALGLLFLSPNPALATTFGPIRVVDQTENAEFTIQGRVSSAPWVAMDRASNRPYTHWKYLVAEQFKGNTLPQEITIRSPGGEINGMGYRIAGAATFREGEEGFLQLKRTEEGDILEVVALASGKYTIEAKNPPQVVSGLGAPILGSSGRPLKLDEFEALLRRAGKGQATDQDREIFAVRNMSHDHDPALEAQLAEAKALRDARDHHERHHQESNPLKDMGKLDRKNLEKSASSVQESPPQPMSL